LYHIVRFRSRKKEIENNMFDWLFFGDSSIVKDLGRNLGWRRISLPRLLPRSLRANETVFYLSCM